MQKSASAEIGSSPALRIILTLRPPRAPAKMSSLIPSGNGITAESVIAGEPPTKMLTRNGSPRRIAAA